MSLKAIKFDNQQFFDHGQHIIEVMSWRRGNVQRGFAGLDGMVSMDLGRRERNLRQYGYLAASSIEALTALGEDIAAYIDGQVYEMIDQNGRCYSQVRMDSFTTSAELMAGNQARCKYEIIYTQLGE